MNVFGKYTIWIVVAAVVVFACGGLYGLYSYVNNVRNEGIDWETRLTVQYLDNQNFLSAYVSGFYEEVSVAQAESNVLDQILTDAVKGRYDKNGFAINSPLFAAVVEGYPEAGVAELMANWGKVQDYIAAGREGYRNQQTKLLDMLRGYYKWRTEGYVHSFFVRLIGFPSEMLQARVGDRIYTGELAFDKMFQIVLTSQVIEAYESGVMDPLTVPDPNQP